MDLILTIATVVGYIMIGEFVYGIMAYDKDGSDIIEEFIFVMAWPVIILCVLVFGLVFTLDKLFSHGPFSFMKDFGKKIRDKFWK